MSTAGFPRWQDMTTPEIRALAARDPVVILPLAAIEQHGPHLPLSTDLDIGLGLLDAAASRLGDAHAVVVLPPIAVAASMEHESFPGTLSLDPETAQAVIRHHGAAVVRAGFRRLLLCNSHGGNTQVMDLAGLCLRRDHGLLVVKCSYFRLPPPADLDLPTGELRHGLHGGAIETSMMLHLQRDSVRTALCGDRVSVGFRLERELARLGPEGEASFSWMTEDLHPDGAVGNALLADADLGARLVAHYGAAIAQVIRDTAAFPLDVLQPAKR